MKRIFITAGLTAFVLGPLAQNFAHAAPRAKVNVCHGDADSGESHVIRISESALPAHLNHGDFETDSEVGSPCGVPD